MSEQVRFALRLQLATAQRRGEVVDAEWAEIDRETGVWTIPPEKSKDGIYHRVLLSSLALELLDAIEQNLGGSRWLFPSPRGEKPITGRAIDHAFRNNLDRMGLDAVTPHDLRRTAASCMTRMGINRLVVAKVLNHTEASVTAVYDRHSYDREKLHALEVWGVRLGEMISENIDADNVVPLARISEQS